MLPADGQKELHQCLLSSASLWISAKWHYFVSTHRKSNRNERGWTMKRLTSKGTQWSTPNPNKTLQFQGGGPSIL